MENTWVDFRSIKAAVSLRMALDHYGVNWLRKSGDELRGRCPIHKGEGENTFHASLSKNAFQCFSCKARGNVLDLVAAMENCSIREAAQKLNDWFTLTIPNTSSGKESTPAHQTKAVSEKDTRNHEQDNPPLKFQLKGIDPTHPYLAERGISKETAEEFGLGFFAGKGSMHGRVVIPIHNERAELIAYAGRSIDDSEPKYKLPPGFHKHLVLFNLHRAIDRKQASSTTVVLVEGFSDCIKVHEAGYPCVALIGAALSKEQEDLLCSHFSGIIILLDGDEAGKTGTDACLLRLGRKLWVKAVVLALGKQPDMLNSQELQEVLES